MSPHLPPKAIADSESIQDDASGNLHRRFAADMGSRNCDEPHRRVCGSPSQTYEVAFHLSHVYAQSICASSEDEAIEIGKELYATKDIHAFERRWIEVDCWIAQEA